MRKAAVECTHYLQITEVKESNLHKDCALGYIPEVESSLYNIFKQCLPDCQLQFL